MGARRVALAGSGRGAATFLHRHPTRTNTCVRAPTSRGAQLCPACGSEETCRVASSKVTDRWPVGAAIRRVVRSANFAIRFFPCNISCVGLLPSWSAYDHTIIRASFSHISLFKPYFTSVGIHTSCPPVRSARTLRRATSPRKSPDHAHVYANINYCIQSSAQVLIPPANPATHSAPR